MGLGEGADYSFQECFEEGFVNIDICEELEDYELHGRFTAVASIGGSSIVD